MFQRNFWKTLIVMLSVSGSCLAEQLLFVSTHQAPGRDLYLYDLERHELKALTEGNRDNYEPQWSPDGQFVVYVKNTESLGSELYIMAPDKGEEHVVASSPYSEYSPQWSPLGDALIFCSDRDGVINLYLFKPADNSITPVTDSEFGACNPRWSPNAATIAFLQYNEKNKGTVAFYETDSGAISQIPQSVGKENGELAWSPNGQEIAYSSSREQRVNLYLFSRKTKQEQQLTDLKTVDRYPVWGRDGTAIYFLSAREHGVNTVLHKLDLATRDIKRISASGQFEAEFILRNDMALVSSYEEGLQTHIYSMPLNSGNKSRLVPLSGYQTAPSIRPGIHK